jgi:Na+/proline symporter
MATYDNLYVIVMFFAMAVLAVISTLTWNGLAASSLFTDSVYNTGISQNIQDGYDTFDFLLVIMFMGSNIAILVLVFLLRSHPIIYIIGFILVIATIIMAVIISNAWEDMASDPNISGVVSASFSNTNTIFTQLPGISTVFGLITLVVMAGLARMEGMV